MSSKMAVMATLATTFIVATAIDHGPSGTPAPPNPLGLPLIGSSEQYRNLRDDFGFDISEDAGPYSFELDAPPLFLDLARFEVGNAWRLFVSSEYHSQCLYDYSNTEAWAGQCKSTMSELRDSLNKYSALYPGAGERYDSDPWDTIQEDIAHQGYSRTGNLVDKLQRDAAQGLQYWNDWVNPWIQTCLTTIGEYGDLNVFGLATNPTWGDYVLLYGDITNEGGAIDSKTPFNPRFGTEAIQNKQFWGTNSSNGAKEGFDGFENLGLLFRVQLGNAFGETDDDWYEIMNYQDLTYKMYGSYVCELKFHDLRKIIRMMWRTMSDNPQIMPLGFFTASIDCPSCKGGKFPALSDPAEDLFALKIDGKSVLQQMFTNSEESREWFRSLGWDDAVINLATSMALGGYYHLDYFDMDPSVDEARADMEMDQNNLCWDFIQRMGYIHDLLLDYTVQAAAGAGEDVLNPVKDRINGLWFKFVDWCDRNFMLDLLKYKLNPYFPVGNATASRQLAPSLPVSNLPFMIINTHGRSIPCTTPADTDACNTYTSDQKEVPATMELYEFDTRDDPVYLNITIKGHGESSRQWPKKTFAISFYLPDYSDTDDVPFLGMHKNDEFVLKGFYVDMTLNRDVFAYNMSRNMGQWAPHTRQTEIYLIEDDLEPSYALHYKGVYTVMETISRGKHRVDIPKNGIKTDDKTGKETEIPAGDGGFIFTVDKFDPEFEAFHTLPQTQINVQIKYPGKTHVTDDQAAWAWNLLDQFEEDMYGPNWLKTGEPGAWDQWIDLESWAVYFIHAELMKSVDAYRFSTYFWTEGANHTLKFGPAWDYDLSSGNTGWVVDLTGQVKQSHSWQYMWALTIATDRWTGEPQSIPQEPHTPCAADWFYKLLDVPAFKEKVSEVYFQARDNQLSDESIKSIIADQKENVKKGSNRNFAVWATLDRVDIWPHFPPPIESTLDGKWEQFSEYLLGRVKWLDENIYGYIPHPNMEEGTTCDPGMPIPDCLNNFQAFPVSLGLDICNKDPGAGFWWVRANWQSGLKFFNQSHPYTDGSDCSVLEYLHYEHDQMAGGYDCPIPGGPTGILPPHYDPSTPMSCGDESSRTCGDAIGVNGMTEACRGTLDWLMNNWDIPKYTDAGVDGTACSCQNYLYTAQPELQCPEVRGAAYPLYCVNNRCQKDAGTWSPTPHADSWEPTTTGPPTTDSPTTSSPTSSPTATPIPTEPPKTTCGTEGKNVTDAVCAAYSGKVAKDPTTSCTDCDESDCCGLATCGEQDWCAMQADTGEPCVDDPCQKIKGPNFVPVDDDVTCTDCDLNDCCTEHTCESFVSKCPSGTQELPNVGCRNCDASECCEAVTPPGSDSTDTSSSAGTVVAAVVGVFLVGAAGAFFYLKKKPSPNTFVILNDDSANYVAPPPVVSSSQF